MNPVCVDFRRTFEPGMETLHRQGCPGCQAFAQTVEQARAAGARLPLPTALAAQLSSLGQRAKAQADSEVLPNLLRPVPRLPLPGELEQRLRRIRQHQTPPHWLRSPAATLAASLVLTVLLGAVVDQPAARLQRLAGQLERQVEASALSELPRWLSPDFRGVVSPAESALRRSLTSAQLTLETWVEKIEAAFPKVQQQPANEN